MAKPKPRRPRPVDRDREYARRLEMGFRMLQQRDTNNPDVSDDRPRRKRGLRDRDSD